MNSNSSFSSLQASLSSQVHQWEADPERWKSESWGLNQAPHYVIWDAGVQNTCLTCGSIMAVWKLGLYSLLLGKIPAVGCPEKGLWPWLREIPKEGFSWELSAISTARGVRASAMILEGQYGAVRGAGYLALLPDLLSEWSWGVQLPSNKK